MARKKQPKYKKEDLVNMIVEWAIDGVPQTDIKKRIFKLGYEISYFYTLYNEAKPIIRQTLIEVSKDRLEETIAEMEKMKQDALDENDKRLAFDIKREINKISGLHQQRVDITTKGDKINQIEVIKIIEVKKEDDEEA